MLAALVVYSMQREEAALMGGAVAMFIGGLFFIAGFLVSLDPKKLNLGIGLMCVGILPIVGGYYAAFGPS